MRFLVTLLLIIIPSCCGAVIKSVQVLAYSDYWLCNMDNRWGRGRNTVSITVPPHTQQLICIISTYSGNAIIPKPGEKTLKQLLSYCLSGNTHDSAKSRGMMHPHDTARYVEVCLLADSTSSMRYGSGCRLMQYRILVTAIIMAASYRSLLKI